MKDRKGHRISICPTILAVSFPHFDVEQASSIIWSGSRSSIGKKQGNTECRRQTRNEYRMSNAEYRISNRKKAPPGRLFLRTSTLDVHHSLFDIPFRRHVDVGSRAERSVGERLTFAEHLAHRAEELARADRLGKALGGAEALGRVEVRLGADSPAAGDGDDR